MVMNPRLLKHSDAPERFSEITTEANVEPSATKIQLRATEDAIALYTGWLPHGENFLDFCVSLNGGEAKVYRLHRMQKEVIRCSAGAAVAIGANRFWDSTAVARSLTILPTSTTAHPAIRSVSGGETDDANADKDWPANWTPTAPHIVLDAEHSAFQINDSGAAQTVYWSEFDGVNWSPVCWVKVPSGENRLVHTRFKKIALMTVSGATVNVTANGTIGGVSEIYEAPFTPIRQVNVTTAAELKAAWTARQADDDIVCAAGTYALDVQLAVSSAPYNFRLRGATGNRDDVVITGDGANNHGTIDFDMNGTYTPFHLRDITFDGLSQATGIGLNFESGAYRLHNVRAVDFDGVGCTDAIAWESNATERIDFEAIDSEVDTCREDGWNGNGNANTNAASRVVVVNSNGFRAGQNGDQSSQNFTSHGGLPFEIYGGEFSDTVANSIANDGLSTVGYLYGVTCKKLTRRGRALNCVWFDLEHDDLTAPDGYLHDGPSMAGNITGCTSAGGFSRVNNTAADTVKVGAFGFRISSTGRCFHWSTGGGHTAEGWWAKASGDTIRIDDEAAAGTAIQNMTDGSLHLRCGWIDAPTTNSTIDGKDLDQIDFCNIIVDANSTTFAAISGTNTNLRGDGNILGGSSNANYTARNGLTPATDLFRDAGGANNNLAQVDATTGQPTAAGNCDGNGYAAGVPYDAGGMGADYLPLKYRSDSICKGAVHRTVLLANWDMFPVVIPA